jgi:hypothetical protein
VAADLVPPSHLRSFLFVLAPAIETVASESTSSSSLHHQVTNTSSVKDQKEPTSNGIVPAIIPPRTLLPPIGPFQSAAEED